ncbi:Putative ParB-like nuclease [Delftia tsuruhatensis]|nr:ParB-like protein [Delftia tsuruhatensis]CAB5719096.1 Putative ParB-like nuclease [Delftia tsuruhatensis]CAC9687733.1 Putative ParB-like nuclease [Delftia tsuruhatensis]
MTIGAAEVQTKRAQWSRLKRKEREGVLASHWFPAVLGPRGLHYIVDHHHLGLAHGAEARYLSGWSGIVAPQT